MTRLDPKLQSELEDEPSFSLLRTLRQASSPARPAHESISNRVVQYIWRFIFEIKELIGYTAIFLLVYSAVYTVPYALTDDYYMLHSEQVNVATSTILGTVVDGRELYGYMVTYALSQISTLSDLEWLRLFGVIGVALFLDDLLRAAQIRNAICSGSMHPAPNWHSSGIGGVCRLVYLCLLPLGLHHFGVCPNSC